MKRLPPGRHGLSREEVRESQRQRLVAAATESLAEHGYGQVTTTAIAKRAGVSTATLYKRLGDLWACLLAAYEADGERLCGRIEEACAAAGGGEERARAGIAGAVKLLAAEPALAHLLSTEPPGPATDLWAARRRLLGRLSNLLRGAREPEEDGERATRLVAGAFALVSIRARAGDGARLEDLTPALTEFLLA